MVEYEIKMKVKTEIGESMIDLYAKMIVCNTEVELSAKDVINYIIYRSKDIEITEIIKQEV